MPCLQVDGNALFATVYAAKLASEYARKHKKPYFIEMVTYRLGDHTTADDAKRYRDESEVSMWRGRDPITRIKNFMMTRKLWDETKEAALLERVAKDNADAVARAENIEAPHRDAFFNAMYEEIPADLLKQRDTMHTHSLGQDPSQLPAEARERAAAMSAGAATHH